MTEEDHVDYFNTDNNGDNIGFSPVTKGLVLKCEFNSSCNDPNRGKSPACYIAKDTPCTNCYTLQNNIEKAVTGKPN